MSDKGPKSRLDDILKRKFSIRDVVGGIGKTAKKAANALGVDKAAGWVYDEARDAIELPGGENPNQQRRIQERARLPGSMTIIFRTDGSVLMAARGAHVLDLAMNQLKANGSRDLSKLYMARRRITDVDFAGFNLSETDFRRAGVENSRFDGCNLAGVDFREANLEGVSFVEANLKGIDLRGTKCSSGTANDRDKTLAKYRQTRVNFYGADLTGAKVSLDTDLVGADLYGAKLDGVEVYDREGQLIEGATLGADGRIKLPVPKNRVVMDIDLDGGPADEPAAPPKP
ncbi:MAG: hypothetical protein Alpg2KO_30950 [Alphaproteobacteria bacterium]